MKLNFSLLAILFSIIIIIPSCKKDKAIDDREQFLGTYNITDLCEWFGPLLIGQ